MRKNPLSRSGSGLHRFRKCYGSGARPAHSRFSRAASWCAHGFTARLLVRAEGLEPSRSLRPNGFSYPLRLSPPCRKSRPRDAPAGLWSGLYLHHGRSARRRLAARCCPSSLYTFPSGVIRRSLARDRHLTGFPEFEQFCIAGFPASTQVA